MICMKCGHKNSGDAKYCQKCNAILLRMYDDKNTGEISMLDVEDGFSYLYPEHVYVTPIVQNLMEAIYNFHLGVGTLAKVQGAFSKVKRNFLNFENGLLQEMLETMDSYKEDEFGREYSRQMIYLLNKGSRLTKEGIEQIDEFFEGNEDRKLLSEGILRIQEGNDNFGLISDLMKANLDVLEQEKSRREMTARAQEFEQRIRGMQEEKQPPAGEESGEENPEAEKAAEKKPEEQPEEESPVVTMEEDIIEVADLEQ
ncbi:MAG: hypothetical protein M1269_12485 [Chloroflexi bacterium]|nr:hypothetical protein [Chloroflexota bacterium]